MKQLKRNLKMLSEIKIFSILRINIWFFPVLICSFLGNYQNLFLAAFSIAAVHELSHVLCAKLLRVSVSHITVYPFGIAANLTSEYIKRSDKEFVISFAGPFSNLIMFWLFNSLSSQYSVPIFQFCADINLAMCALNLIPALPLDGGRMLKSILSSKYGTIRAYNITLKISRFSVIILAALSVFMFFATNFNFSLILVSAFLFQNLSREQMSISHIMLKEILENNQKLKDSTIFPVRTFCVDGDTRASLILRLLSHDYFCIIHIIDKHSGICKTVTETEVLEILTQNGIRAKFSDIK